MHLKSGRHRFVIVAVLAIAVVLLSTPCGAQEPYLVVDLNSANDSDTGVDSLELGADLGIFMTNHRGEIVESHETTYKIAVWNDGPNDAFGIEVDDIFPPELTGCTWYCAPLGAPSCRGVGPGDIAHVIDLGVWEWVQYTGTCTVVASSGMCSNTATVTAPAGMTDPDPSNNFFTDSDHVTALANFIYGDGFETRDPCVWSLAVPPPAEDCPVCGNGMTESGETCDDGNLVEGDGCTGCKQDFGFFCNTTLEPSVCYEIDSLGTFDAWDLIPEYESSIDLLSGDSEWFMITFTEAVLFSGELTALAYGDPDLYLYDSYDSDGLVFAQVSVGDESWFDEPIAPGTYLLVVVAWDDIGLYLLSMSTTSP